MSKPLLGIVIGGILGAVLSNLAAAGQPAQAPTSPNNLSSLEGLFAAGDVLFASDCVGHAAATGHYAGRHAADFAAARGPVAIDPIASTAVVYEMPSPDSTEPAAIICAAQIPSRLGMFETHAHIRTPRFLP